MRLIQSIVGVTSQHSAADAATDPSIIEYNDRPFVDWLNTKRLSPKLSEIVTFAIAQCDYDQMTTDELNRTAATAEAANSRVTTGVAVARMRAYLSSLGRYRSGAYLYALYGTSELPQAFSRLAAVNGTVYILRYQPQAIVIDAHRTYKGIITANGQYVTSDNIILEPEYLPAMTASTTSSAVGASVETVYSRAICIIDSPLRTVSGSEFGDLSVSIIPPLALANRHAVRIIQVSHAVRVVPSGQYVLYVSMPALLASAREDLIVSHGFNTKYDR